jgi:O-acetylserine/cysteine efflux transporter
LALSIAVEGPVPMIACLSSIQPSGVADLAYIIYVSTWFGVTIWSSLLARYSTATVTPFARLVAVVGPFLSTLVL